MTGSLSTGWSASGSVSASTSHSSSSASESRVTLNVRRPSQQPREQKRRGLSLRFERGTVLLEGSPWRVEQLRVPELRWDRRVSAHRLPGYRYGELVAALAAARMPFVDLPSAWDRRVRVRISAPVLRDYQRDALATWQEAGGRGVIVLPTGSGKTVVAQAAIAAVGRPTLVVVPTRTLLEQWASSLSALPARPQVARFGDGLRQVGPLTVATFAAVERHAERLAERFELLVVDEAHHAAGRVRGEPLELLLAPLRLGLTATPPDAERDPQGAARLAARIGPPVFRVPRSRLCEAGHLAPFDVQRLLIELEPEERLEYERCRELGARARLALAGPDGRLPSWKTMIAQGRQRGASENGALAEAFAARRRMRQVVARAAHKRATAGRLLDQLGPESRCLIFCADNEATYALSRELLVPAITCETSRGEREVLLDDFRAGRVRALVSARVLGEGVDLPQANCALVLGSAIGGVREPAQRLGRLLRPRGNKRAVVYELLARGTHEVAEGTARQLALVR